MWNAAKVVLPMPAASDTAVSNSVTRRSVHAYVANSGVTSQNEDSTYFIRSKTSLSAHKLVVICISIKKSKLHLRQEELLDVWSVRISHVNQHCPLNAPSIPDFEAFEPLPRTILTR